MRGRAGSSGVVRASSDEGEVAQAVPDEQHASREHVPLRSWPALSLHWRVALPCFVLTALPPAFNACREMQGRRGAGRKLRDLSAEKLGRAIQRSGRRHSPRQARLGARAGSVAGSGALWCDAAEEQGQLCVHAPPIVRGLRLAGRMPKQRWTCTFSTSTSSGGGWG